MFNLGSYPEEENEERKRKNPKFELTGMEIRHMADKEVRGVEGNLRETKSAKNKTHVGSGWHLKNRNGK